MDISRRPVGGRDSGWRMIPEPGLNANICCNLLVKRAGSSILAAMKILGIETSCDETAAAVVEDGSRITSNVIASQIDIHARYGGIVPEVASRQHLLTIIPVISQSMTEVSWQDINGIAVTFGPGLAGSLLVGVNIAKAIALAKEIPVVGINHLEAHIYANWLDLGNNSLV